MRLIKMFLIMALLFLPFCIALPPADAATLYVTTKDDNVEGSLRQAISTAQSGDTIEFRNVPYGTAVVTTPLVIDKNLTINGGGIIKITGDHCRILTVNQNCTLTLQDLTLDHGADADGGAVRNEGTVIAGNSVFQNNGGSQGSAINNTGTVTINNCTFKNNTSNWGSIYNGGTATINNCTFADNSSDYGGAIRNHGSVDINNCTFARNRISDKSGIGGAIYNEGSATISSSTFQDNSAKTGGGAICNYDNQGTITLSNCTLNNNFAKYGGAIANWGTTSIKNCTFNNNEVKSSAAAIYSVNNTTTITNCIIWGDKGKENDFGNVRNVSVSYSDIKGGFGGTGNIDKNPLLGDPGNYGGSVDTFPLLPGSPAINTGTDVDLTTDARGISRPAGAYDMGAFESRGFTLSSLKGAPQSAVIGQNFAASLSLTVTSPNGEPVNGGLVTFTAPTGAGPSASFSSGNEYSGEITSGEASSSTLTANNTPGVFTVVGSAGGADSVNFELTNTQPFDLSISKTHSDEFTQGDSGTYTIRVTNNGPCSTVGTVSVSDSLPNGLTATGLSGEGWNCDLAALTATRNDPLASGESYPELFLSVNVADNAFSSLTNSVSVSAAAYETNTDNNTVHDSTPIKPALASNGNNTVTLNLSNIPLGSSITITAAGDRHDAAGAIVNEERYIPVTWTSSEPDSGTFTLSNGSYTSAYTPATAGNYNITATFQKQTWDGSAWKDTAGSSDTKTANLTVTVALSSAHDILTFTLPEQTGAAAINNGAHTVNIEAANGANPASLTPAITVSAGATINPASGAAQDFSVPVTYTVTAENGTPQDWTVTVTVALSSAHDILTFTLPEQTGPAVINNGAHTVNIEVANGANSASLTPAITVSSGATIDPASGAAQDFTAPVTYTVTAENGTPQNWTVTVTVASSSANDILNFTLPEQTGAATINNVNHTVNIEVANGANPASLTPAITVSSGATINPASGTAQDFTNPVTYTVTAENGTPQNWTVTVTAASSSANDILNFTLPEQTGPAVINNGAHTVNIEVANGANPASLTPAITVSSGATIDPASGTAQDFSAPVTYTVTAENSTPQNWTVTVTVASSSANDILNCTLPQETGAATIDNVNHTVNIEIANGTNPASLTPTITVSSGATIDPASGIAQDFSVPVIYTVTAEDGTPQDWTVTVTVASSSANDILNCTLPQETSAATIDNVNHTVNIEIANGTNPASLTPTITVSSGATIDPASGIAQDFSVPVIYTVTAEDGTPQDWTVTVAVASVTPPPPPAGGGSGRSSSSIDTGLRVTRSGGTIGRDGVTITFPAGATESDIRVTIRQISQNSGLNIPDGSILLSCIMDIVKYKSGSFQKPVTITLSFDKSKLDDNKYDIAVYYYDEDKGEWIALQNISVDIEEGKASGDTTHFTKFAVIATPKNKEEKPEPPAPQPSITIPGDIFAHWAKESIMKVINAGVVSGYPDGSFQPDKTISRAEYTVMLVKALKLESKTSNSFSDTAAHWAKDSISTAVANGFISGFDKNTFGPDDPITREQVAAIIARAAKLQTVTEELNFSDSQAISAWARAGVAAAVKGAFFSGYPDGSFKPQLNMTRAEAATIIGKLL